MQKSSKMTCEAVVRNPKGINQYTHPKRFRDKIGKFMPNPANFKPTFFNFVVDGAMPLTKRPYQLQCELFEACQANKIIEILLPREHGKSYFLAYYPEYLLEHEKENVLLLSWTDIRKVTSQRVYQYFYMKGLLSEVPGIYNSPMHFTLKNGAKFDCYSITAREVLGFHNYTMIVDDPLDITFRERREKERMLELIWLSTMENINPNKLIICGTKKFEEDFFFFIERTYGDDLFKFVRTPYNEDGSLICPEKWTIEKLQKKRATIGEYMYSAEYLQDPHPIAGGVLQEGDITYKLNPEHWNSYDYCCIAVDSAWTTNETSDLTAIVIILRLKDSTKFLVIACDTGKWLFDDILNRVESHYDHLRIMYPECSFIVPIESNSGGNYLIQHANHSYNFAIDMIAVHHDKNKIVRIVGAVETPIKNGSIMFLESLKDSELMWELLTLPNCQKFDAADSLAMGITALRDRYSPLGDVWDRVNQ